MRKARKMVIVLLMAFGLVSVSFGAWIPEDVEKNYQKLKAEMAEYGNAEECKWSEDGKKLVNERSESLNDLRLCKFQKVVLFFDEIRAKEVKVESCKKRYWARDCYPVDKFGIAVEEVREMPIFKEDSRIYNYKWKNKENWWKDLWNNWESAKNKMEMDGARRGYWKKLAE